MAKVIRTENRVTVIYDNGDTCTIDDDLESSKFVFAVLNSDDEKELEQHFPRTKKVEGNDLLNRLRKQIKMKNEVTGSKK